MTNWPDDLDEPIPEHELGTCEECDWNRWRIAALIEGRGDPGPFRGGAHVNNVPGQHN